MAEKILFPMKDMRLTTGVNMLSHKGSNAIDIAGKDTGIQRAFAPFTGVIKRIYKLGNTVWIESVDKVEYADGRVDFATANFTHDNSVSELRVGQVIPQGTYFYDEGTNNASGAHIHLEIGVGKFTGTGWHQNSYGNWVINNSIEPWKAFWLKDVNVIEGMGYPWKVYNEAMTRAEAEDMTNVLRVLNSEAKGWNRNEVHSGKYDKQEVDYLMGLSDKPSLAIAAYSQQAWDEGTPYRKKKDAWLKAYNEAPALNEKIEEQRAEIDELAKLLEEKPTEIVVEVPVEKVVIKEVNTGDQDRTFGDLLGAAFKKLFNVK